MCGQCPTVLDIPNTDAATEAFAERLLGMYNASATTLFVSIGHRTGLFDAMNGLAPSTSQEIADAAELNERYVREWLDGLVVGGLLSYDPETKRYELPAAHAAVLSRANPTSNMAAFAQYTPLLGAVEEPILKCFKEGGGLAYSDYDRFHEVMAEDSGQSVLPELTRSIIPLVDGMRERLEEGAFVLDMGCGSGLALNQLAVKFPDSKFVGYDLCDEALETGRRVAKENGVTNLAFAARDATEVNDKEKFDLVTAFDAIHDQKDPDQVLRNIRQALKPGGVFLMQDIAGSSHVEKNLDHPMAPLLYAVSCMHCMSVSLGQGGAGYGAMWGQELAEQKLREAGFSDITVHRLPHDPQNAYYVCRP